MNETTKKQKRIEKASLRLQLGRALIDDLFRLDKVRCSSVCPRREFNNRRRRGFNLPRSLACFPRDSPVRIPEDRRRCTFSIRRRAEEEKEVMHDAGG